MENIYTAPEANLIDDSEKLSNPVWNPDAAGLWSLLFTPLFGSILVKKNWETIGDQDEYERSKKWVVLSAVFLIPGLFIPFVSFIFIITWYFMSQKQQTKYLKEKWGKDYLKRSWGKPLLIGFVVAIPIYVINIILTAAIQ